MLDPLFSTVGSQGLEEYVDSSPRVRHSSSSELRVPSQGRVQRRQAVVPRQSSWDRLPYDYDQWAWYSWLG